MPLCSFDENYLTLGVTPVENMFILNYLPHASGDYVRVYLYGLMQCHHPDEDMTLERMGHLLELTTETIQSAYQYWERQGLVQRVSDNPPSYQYLNIVSSMANESPMEKAMYRHREFNTRMQQLFGNRLLRPADFMTACEWIEDLNLPEEVVLIMIEHSIAEKGRSFQFKQLNATALQWAEKGIVTVEAANKIVLGDTKAWKMAERVLKQFNLRRLPTVDEINMARKWGEDWGLDEETVLVACRETVKGRNPSFGYLDGILSRNHSAKSSDEMADRLDEKKRLEDAVKALHEALGLRQMSPTPQELESYQNYLAAGFEPEAVLCVARAIGGSGRFDMSDLDRKMTDFVEKGLLTEEAVTAYLDRQKELRAQAAQIFETSGQDSRVNAAAAAQMEEWLQLAPFPLVNYAAECARGTKLPSQYISKLLREWKKADIVTVEEAKRRHGAIKPASGGAAASQKPTPTSMQYAQRTYAGDELNRIAMAFMEDDDDAK